MNVVLSTAVLVNLGVIAALPRVFFRKGKFNAAWWFTALPFGVAGAGQAGALAGLLEPALAPSIARESLAVVLTSASFLLIGYTAGTHREPVSLWHQEDDLPARLTTHGAYARVRHPFYAAFLLTLGAAVLAMPHWLTLLSLIYGGLRLNATAAREEHRLLSSPFGAEYACYVALTGRFLPYRGIRADPIRRRFGTHRPEAPSGGGMSG